MHPARIASNRRAEVLVRKRSLIKAVASKALAIKAVAIKALAAVTVAAAVGVLGSGDAKAGGGVHILVFMEHGVGSPAQAQPYVDKLVEQAKAENGWSDAEGKYTTTRSQADEY